MPSPLPRLPLLWPLLLGILAPRVPAQTAPPRPAPAPVDPVVRTPFTVSTAKDTGYAASETLAGTRMRTSLRDVGASLTVLTPEFL